MPNLNQSNGGESVCSGCTSGRSALENDAMQCGSYWIGYALVAVLSVCAMGAIVGMG